MNGSTKPIAIVIITEYSEGDGQSIRVDHIVASLVDSYKVFIFAQNIKTHRIQEENPIFLPIGNYITTFLNIDFILALKKADLIVIETGLPYIFNAFLSRKPFIYVVHGPDPLTLFKGKLKLRNILSNIIEISPLLRLPDGIIAPTEWIANYYESRKLNCFVVYAGVDEIFVPSNTKMRDTIFPKLITVGDWDGFNGRKRQHEFIYIFDKILDKFPNAQLTLVGLSNQSKKILEKISHELGTSGKIKFIGKISQLEVANELKINDIYVATTISDTFYRPIIEAFSCGLPSITRDSRNLVKKVNLGHVYHTAQSSAGILYDGSSNSAITAIETILSNYSFFSANAIRYAKKFNTGEIIKSYRAIFSQFGIRLE